jgi:DNA polymerase-3 subunit gamma/tau
LPTILSRCQRFDLHRIPANLIAKHLQFIADKEKITLDPAAAHAIAKGADGGLRDAESMLDQLVAFCGEKIAEPDVLNVFGFTSEQTVAHFTDKILRGETPEALELLHAEAENGKDMMKLMSDLISYLRDLLVGKVKPDALADDLNPDLQKSLEAQAAMIETDRLLELIDQFAAAEGRMKWAPNKRLHFEVAVIKAIQTLSQVTLNEVIEKLAALRDGKEGPPKKIAVAAPDRGKEEPRGARPAVSSESVRSHEAPRVAEQASQHTTTDADPAVDPAKVWQQVTARIPSQKAFLRNSAAAAHVLGIDGRSLHLGFAPDQKSLMDILGTQTNRKFLEALVHEISGGNWGVKLSVKDDLAPRTEPPPAIASPARAPDFKDDPLIREALEIFKGEIKTVSD